MQKPVLMLLGCLLICSAIPSYGSSAAASGPEAVAKQVLDKLFEAAGQPIIQQPSLKITTENKRVAAYFPKENTIVLDLKAYEVCQSLGKDSLQALAFIIGHELAHALQREVRLASKATNFLSYDKNYHTSTRAEKVADIQGVFSAYLAGYKVGQAVELILPKLYEAYGLNGKPLLGYPPLAERQATAKEVLATTDTLIQLFETANYLIVAEQYEIAGYCLDHVLKYYQGRELYNNRGILYLLAAMEYFLPSTDRFVYPVELDNATQLRKFEKSRGGIVLPAPERLIRNGLLEKAAEQFRMAIKLDKNYWPAKLNLLCCFNLLEKPQQALDFSQKNKMPKLAANNLETGAGLELVLGISHALLNDKAIATGHFFAAKQSRSELLQVQAQYNLDVLNGREQIILVGHFFDFPAEFLQLVKAIQLPRMGQVNPKPLANGNATLKMLRQGNTLILTFGDKDGNIVSIARFENEHVPNMNLLEMSETMDKNFFYNMVAMPKGFYLKSEDADAVVKVDENGKVLEMARLFRHRQGSRN